MGGAHHSAERTAELTRDAFEGTIDDMRNLRNNICTFDDFMRLFQPSATADRRRAATNVPAGSATSAAEARAQQRQRAINNIIQRLQRMRSAMSGAIPPTAATSTIDELVVVDHVPQPNDDEQDCCCICLDALEAGDQTKVLPCGHSTFHCDCIDEWLSRGAAVCPMCRHAV